MNDLPLRHRIQLQNLRQAGVSGRVDKKLSLTLSGFTWRRVITFKADGLPVALWLQPGHYVRVYTYPDLSRRSERRDHFDVAADGRWEWAADE